VPDRLANVAVRGTGAAELAIRAGFGMAIISLSEADHEIYSLIVRALVAR
jgi:hypothetical protein